MKKTSYRDLEIYQLSHEVAVNIHKFSLNLPKYELYETGSQLRRASKSVSANIVEGYGRRRYKTEFIRYLVIAQASCDESIEWVSYIIDCHEDVKDEAGKIIQQLNELGKKINRFISAVEKRHLSANNIKAVISS
jgi:four helix bundle protein